MAFIPQSGSVVAFQSNPANLQASITGAVQIAGGSPASIVTVQRIDQQITGSNLGLVSHAVIHGLTTLGGGSYVDVKVDPTGALLIAATSVISFQGTVPWTIGSIYGNVSGSVVAFVSGLQGASVSGAVTANQGTNAGLGSSWPVKISNGTQTANVTAASMLSVTVDNVTSSIIGTYSTNVLGNSSSVGLYVLGVRNDTIASIVGSDRDFNSFATDSAGRFLVKPFSPEESRLDTVSSVVSTSVTALFNSVVGLRNYVTDLQIANTGSVATLVTFKDGSTSILGYTIAPAGGGSNITMAMPMRTAPAQDFVYQAGTASSVLYVTAKGYKAP